MTDEQPDEWKLDPTLECSEIVYRLARRRSDLDPDTNTLSPAVFLRRRNYDDVGLSVVIGSVVTIDDAFTDPQYAKRCYGVGTLHVGILRDKSLDTVPDAWDHANVMGIPFPDEDAFAADSVSRFLARHTRTVRFR